MHNNLIEVDLDIFSFVWKFSQFSSRLNTLGVTSSVDGSCKLKLSCVYMYVLHVCMCVCMHACMYVIVKGISSMYICMYVRIYIHKKVCMHVCSNAFLSL